MAPIEDDAREIPPRMSDQSLREYMQDVQQLIEEGRANEALPRAQYLLRRFPRYWLGYRLLAEAALEQDYIRESVELFRRLLSVDPENFVAHAGIATAYDAENNLDEAIWHMMRAFEVSPNVREVRDQLRYLYERRDGRAPGRLRMTRGALARMYMRDGWYDRAIQELTAELATEPERVDLLSALAEAHWYAGQRQEAVQRAHEVLAELPYALKSNLIVAEFYAQEGDQARAERFLRIVEQLDPENELAARMFGESGFLQPKRVPINDGLDEPMHTGSMPALRTDPIPDWLADLSLFNTLEPVDDAVDWDAIVAHESDWRTPLARDTVEALAAWSPEWRTELRRATLLALRERPRAPVVSPPEPVEVAQGVAQPEAPTITEPSVPPWQPALRESTQEALPPLSDSLPAWRAALHEATEHELGLFVEARGVAREAIPLDEPEETTPAAPVEAEARFVEEAPPEEEAPVGAPLIEEEAPTEVDAPAWVEPPTVVAKPAPRPQPQRAAATHWAARLRVDSEVALAEWRRASHARQVAAAEAAVLPVPAESPWVAELRAATDVEALTAEVAPVEAAPAEAAWVAELRAATDLEALTAEVAPVEATPAEAAWVAELRAVTDLEALTAEVAPVEAAPAEAAWVAELRAAMDVEALTAEVAPVDATPAEAAWVAELRAATDLEALTAEVAPIEMVPAEVAWVAELRADSEALISAPTATEAVPSLDTPTWVVTLRAATESVVGASERADTPPPLPERLVEGAEALLHRVGDAAGQLREQAASLEVGATLREQAGHWLARLREETSHAISTLASTGLPSVAERLTGGTGDPSDPTQETSDAPVVTQDEESAEAALPDIDLHPEPSAEWEETVASVTDQWAAPVEVTEPLPTAEPSQLAEEESAPTAEPSQLAEEESSPAEETAQGEVVALDEIGQARRAWQEGRSKEAFEIYQQLFLSGGREDVLLKDEVAAWTASGNAPALAYQLLGDLYRRMGQMQQAVAQYREAINRM